MKFECFLHYVHLIYFARRVSELANHKTLHTLFCKQYTFVYVARIFIITSEA